MTRTKSLRKEDIRYYVIKTKGRYHSKYDLGPIEIDIGRAMNKTSNC